MSESHRPVPPVPQVDLEFRPSSYWDAANPRSALIQNIKGQNRRQMVSDALSGQSAISPGSLEDGILADTLSDNERTVLGAIHPSFMGGEYLPDFLDGEVEIARIVLASVTQDVMSVRARRNGSRRIHYRIVDEYETGRRVKPRSTTEPLTLGQLVHLIDTAENVEEGADLPLLEEVLRWQVESSDSRDPAEIASFLSVESMVYPQLGAYYEQRLLTWVAGWIAESYPDVEEEDEDEEDDEDVCDEE